MKRLFLFGLVFFLVFSGGVLGVVTNRNSGSNDVVGQKIGHVDKVDRVMSVQNLENYVGTNFFVGGTEYLVGDNAKVFIQVDKNGVPLNNVSCFIDIWFSNNSVFVNETLMMLLDKGIYQYNFVVPDSTGVYPLSIGCDLFTETFSFFPDSGVRINGTTGSGTVNDLRLVDNIFFKNNEKPASNRSTGVNFSFPVSSVNKVVSLTLDLFVNWTSKNKPGEPASDLVSYGLLNFSDDSVLFLGAHDYTIGTQEFTFTTFSNLSDFYNGSHMVIVVTDSVTSPVDTRNTKYFLDKIVLMTVNNVTPLLNNIRGGGEVHVSEGEQVVFDEVTKDFVLGVDDLFLFVLFVIIVLSFVFDVSVLYFLAGGFVLFFGLLNVVSLGVSVVLVLVGVGVGLVWRGVGLL